MPSDLRSAVVVACAIIIGMTTISVGLRMGIRTHLKTLGGDDFLILGAWLVLTVSATCAAVSTNYGFGKHRDQVSNSDYDMYLKLFAVISPTFSVGIGLAKSSFAVLYMRINPQRGLTILNLCLIAFLACQAIEESLIALFKCRPVAASWNTDIEGECLDLTPLWWSTFVFNLSTDLILFIQPIPSVWKLQLPLAKRVAIIFMLSLGLLVCAISIIRIVYVTRIGTDDTYEFAEPVIWSVTELGALIVCSCVPCLRQVIQQVPWLNHALGLSSNKTSGAQSYPRRPHGSYPLRTYSSPGVGKSEGWFAGGRGGGYRGDHSQLATMTSRAVGGDVSPESKNDSTDEILFSQDRRATTDNNGIVVTHEVRRDVESNVPSPSSESGSAVEQHCGIDGKN